MSCQSCETKVPLITQGEEKVLNVPVTYETTGLPVDITSASEIIAAFKKSDNTVLQKKLTTSGIVILNGPGGIFQILLSATDTAGLATGSGDGYQSITVKIVIAGVPIIRNANNSIQVEAQTISVS